MWIVCWADNSQVMSILIFFEKYKKKTKMLSAGVVIIFLSVNKHLNLILSFSYQIRSFDIVNWIDFLK